MSTLAYIPARTGSKGIPQKNFLMLGDKQLYAWSIDSAAENEMVDRIAVSIDMPPMQDPAWRVNDKPIHFHERKPEHATDEAQIEPGMIDCLEWMRMRDGYKPEFVALLQPTSPFRPTAMIDQAVELLLETGADSIVAAYRVHPYLWESHLAIGWQPNYNPIARQNRNDQPTILQESGSLHLTRRDMLIDTECRCAGRVEILEHGPEFGLEIDEPYDLWLAEQRIAYEGPEAREAVSRETIGGPE